MAPDFYLIASLVALLPAPVLDYVGGTHRWVLPTLTGFVTTFVTLLVFLHLLPHALHEVGLWALAAGLVGFLLPQLVERLPSRSGPLQRSVALLLIAGLGLHAMVDGAALAGAYRLSAHGLPMAVIAHRLPVGLLVWWIGGGARRPWSASIGLGAIAVATVAGYAGGTAVADWPEDRFALIEAVVGGALLHVLRGHGSARSQSPAAPVAETAGAVVAVLGARLLPSTAHHVGDELLRLALISAPALVLGYLIAGWLGTSLPAASVRWAARGGTLSQAVRGTALGLPIPICSCGVVPVYAGLHRAGVPAAASLAFLIATPELGVESFLLSYPLLGPDMALARLACAAVLAIGVAVMVGPAVVPALAPAAPETGCCPQSAGAPSHHRPSWRAKASQALSVGFSELLESTGPWILLGLAIAALLDPVQIRAAVSGVPGPAAVAGLAALGIPLYVCASGATPMAAALIAAGVSPGAALAFLLSGPATNVTTFGMLKRLHGARVAALFAGGALAGAVGLGVAVDALWIASWRPPETAATVEAVGMIEWAALGILAVASARLVLRRGPVALVRSVFGAAHAVDAAAADKDGCCPT